MTLKTRQENVVACADWDELVTKTYGRPYCFQQQRGCRSPGYFTYDVPSDSNDFEQEEIDEVVNGPKQGVSFKSWLSRDPKQPLKNQKYDFELPMWWNRNFYPDIQIVANDLHEKGLLPAGSYSICIDW